MDRTIKIFAFILLVFSMAVFPLGCGGGGGGEVVVADEVPAGELLQGEAVHVADIADKPLVHEYLDSMAYGTDLEIRLEELELPVEAEIVVRAQFALLRPPGCRARCMPLRRCC